MYNNNNLLKLFLCNMYVICNLNDLLYEDVNINNKM